MAQKKRSKLSPIARVRHELFHTNRPYGMLLFGVVFAVGGFLLLRSSFASGTVPLQIKARGTTGGEVVELSIKNKVVKSWTVSKSFQTYGYSHPESIDDTDIRVAFVNDGRSTNGVDMNVEVDYITVNAEKFETEAKIVYSVGSWDRKAGCKGGNKRSQWLHCNGYFKYSIGDAGVLKAPEPIPTDNTLVVQARGTTGNEKVELKINDKTVQTWTLSKSFQAYMHNVTEQIGDSDIKIAFVNDGNSPEGIDMNVEVDFIIVNGTTYQTESPSVYSLGTWDRSTGCNGGNKSSQWLHCNGYFQYDLSGNDNQPPTPDPAEAVSCDGKTQITISPPAANLATKVSSTAEDTCFYLKNGIYTFHDVLPKNNMVFEGESKGGVVVNGNGQKHAFRGVANDVTIRNMTFRDFNWRNLDGNIWSQLSPILGKQEAWSGNLASGWLIENIESYDNVASGVFVGNNFTVRNSTFRNNGVVGIGGDRFRGGLIENNEIHNNGADQATGQYVNGGGLKFTWADDDNNVLVIRGNTVHTNQGPGIWCDLDCNNVLIENNTVRDNYQFFQGTRYGNRGIFSELSRNMTIRGNTVSSSHEAYPPGSCIGTNGSTDVLIENNTLDGCNGALVVKVDQRPGRVANPDCNDRNDISETYLDQDHIRPEIMSWTDKNITFRNNTIRNSKSVGAYYEQTKCINNVDALTDTIRFVSNSYDDTSGMKFWWKGSTLNYQQWQSLNQQ